RIACAAGGHVNGVVADDPSRRLVIRRTDSGWICGHVDAIAASNQARTYHIVLDCWKLRLFNADRLEAGVQQEVAADGQVPEVAGIWIATVPESYPVASAVRARAAIDDVVFDIDLVHRSVRHKHHTLTDGTTGASEFVVDDGVRPS